jgi:putative hydrolase
MLKIDFHIHSLHSGHAFGSLKEIIDQANKNFPRKYGKINVLWGAELNVLNDNGEVDLPDYILESLDVVLLGFHQNCGYIDKGKKKNTLAFLKAMDNPFVKIIAHPTHNQYPCDLDKVFQGIMDKGLIPEINIARLRYFDDLSIFKKLIKAVKSRKKKLIANTDAHFLEDIGDDRVLKKYWDKLGLSKDLILNYNKKELIDILGVKLI